MIPFDEAKAAFVLSLYNLLLESDAQEWFTAQQIAARAHLQMKGAFVARIINVTDEDGDDLFHVTSNEGETVYALGREGFLLAERNFAAETINLTAPASDRVVSINHNSDSISLIDSEFERLEAEIKSNNEAFADVPETRDVALAEVASLKALWRGMAVRADRFRVRAEDALRWIAEKASVAAIAELCKHLLKLIFSWS